MGDMQPRREGSVRPDPLEQVPLDLSIAANEITWRRQGTRGRGAGGTRRRQEEAGGGRRRQVWSSQVELHIYAHKPQRTKKIILACST